MAKGSVTAGQRLTMSLSLPALEAVLMAKKSKKGKKKLLKVRKSCFRVYIKRAITPDQGYLMLGRYACNEEFIHRS